MESLGVGSIVLDKKSNNYVHNSMKNYLILLIKESNSNTHMDITQVQST